MHSLMTPGGKPPHYKYQFTPLLLVVQGSTSSTALLLKGIQWLYLFFTSSSHELSFHIINNPFKPTYVHSTLLSHSTASRVYTVLDNNNKVIKLYFKDEADHEAGVLSWLAQEGIPNMPQLVKANTDTDMGLILSPCTTNLQLSQFALHHTLQALNTLQAAHKKASLVHRDIHPANLLLQDNSNILVNNWGFAIPTNKPRPYSSTFIHASNSVLRHITEGKMTFTVGPADNLVSLVHTTLVLNFPCAAATLIKGAKKARCPPPEVAHQLITRWKSWLPLQWAKLQALAEKCDYDGVHQGLKKGTVYLFHKDKNEKFVHHNHENRPFWSTIMYILPLLPCEFLLFCTADQLIIGDQEFFNFQKPKDQD
jgi:serine/threonine protein kinase